MGQQLIEAAFFALVERSVRLVDELGLPLGRHAPFLDRRYDEHFTELTEFGAARQRLETLVFFEKHYGAANATRFTLAYLYAYLETAGARIHKASFDTTWRAFWADLHEPDWRFLAVCNLVNFKHSVGGVGAFDAVDLGDGLTIRGRTEQWASSIDDSLWSSLADDWHAGSYGSHVLVAEVIVPKTPENVVLANPPDLLEKLIRGILGLRLATAGDLRHGRINFVRAAKIRGGSGGGISSGRAGWNPGEDYDLDDAALLLYRDVYNHLKVASPALGKGWIPLATALRRFSGLYERDFVQREDRILDAITAIEALLGDKSETVFKVRSRVANLLGSDDDARVELFKSMNIYYDTRSCLVHGSELKTKHHDVIQNPNELFKITRLLLVGFLRLVVSNEYPKATTLKEGLDEILLHSARRQGLRAKMGL